MFGTAIKNLVTWCLGLGTPTVYSIHSTSMWTVKEETI